MKKKTYEQPKMKVVEIEQPDIICTSPYNEGFIKINDGEGFLLDEEEFYLDVEGF